METKDVLLAVIAFLGWSWAIAQFFLTRSNQKKDKEIERRFEAYSKFINKMDEINMSMRSNPNGLYGIQKEFFERVLSGDESEMTRALADFNASLYEFLKASLQPTLILNQEINVLKMVCSDKLLPKLNEFKDLANDLFDQFQIVLNRLSINKDIEVTAKELTNLGHGLRAERLGKLWQEVEKGMREEIRYSNR